MKRFLLWLDQFLIELFQGDSDTFTIDHTTPSMPETTPDPIQPVPPPISQPSVPGAPLLDTFCLEIRAMEGWTPGSTSFTHNNPGNLRCTPGQKQNWNGLATGQVGGFCTFKDPATGMQALRNVTLSCAKGISPTYTAAAKKLGLTNSGELTLLHYFIIRDPASDGNDPLALAQRFGRVLNVDPTKFRMKQLLS